MDAINSVEFEQHRPSYYGRSNVKNENEVYLREKLEGVEDKQGFLGNIWNEFKEITTLGVSKSDCNNMLEKYKNGEISFEEAVEYINSFEEKQDNMQGLISNTLTGIGAIAGSIAMFSNPATITLGMALSAGAPLGAVLKTGINLIDRATNHVKGDEFDAKAIVKDALSGAITGTTSAVSSGVGTGIRNGLFDEAVRNGAMCGVACGAGSGAGNYIINTALDENKKFDFDEMFNQAVTSAAISGTVGAIVGAGMFEGAAKITHTANKKDIVKTAVQRITQDSASSSLRKALGQVERNIMNA